MATFSFRFQVRADETPYGYRRITFPGCVDLMWPTLQMLAEYLDNQEDCALPGAMTNSYARMAQSRMGCMPFISWSQHSGYRGICGGPPHYPQRFIVSARELAGGSARAVGARQ